MWSAKRLSLLLNSGAAAAIARAVRRAAQLDHLAPADQIVDRLRLDKREADRFATGRRRKDHALG